MVGTCHLDTLWASETKCHRPVHSHLSRLRLADQDQKWEAKVCGRSARFVMCSSAKDGMRLLYVPRAYDSDPNVAFVIFPGGKREQITLRGTGTCEKWQGGP